jgi:hypothetical protein
MSLLTRNDDNLVFDTAEIAVGNLEARHVVSM